MHKFFDSMCIQEYIAAHRERFLSEWASLIRIPSVSCQPEHKADMSRCAERWKELLLEAGCQKAEVLPSHGKRNANRLGLCSLRCHAGGAA